jgi:hypothetical protein
MKMRKISTTALLGMLALGFTANAQKVALHSSSGVQIFNGSYALTNAHNAASSGDTLYLSGGTFYAPSQITKPLYIYGAGHYLDSTQATGKTIINGNLILREHTDGMHIEGIDLTGFFRLEFYSMDTVQNVAIAYSKISGNIELGYGSNTYSNNFVLMRSVVLGNIDFTRATNAAVFNSFLQNRCTGSNGVNYENNILFFSNNANTAIVGDNNIIKNCIFFSQYDYSSGVAGNGNQFYNNLFLFSTPNYGGSYTASGNYLNVAAGSVFVNNVLYAFDYANNYHLQNPTAYTGTDGKQVGIYGGTFPYKDGAVPSNPHIQLKNIAPSSDSNGKLQVEFKVSAQNE